MALRTHRKPSEALRDFRDHFNRLLSLLLTDTPLTQSDFGDGIVMMEFRSTDGEPSVAIGDGFYLYLGHTLRAVRMAKNEYRLRTLSYAYRVAEGPRRNDRYLFRWEYVSSDLEQGRALHPRHHVHLPMNLDCFEGRRRINLDKLHLASGWVTIEEVLRFVFHELKVGSRNAQWDRILRASEATFEDRSG